MAALRVGVRGQWSRILAKGVDLPRRVEATTKGAVLYRDVASYRRSDLKFDLAAALTLLAIAVPEQLATARLAGMPVITGFYAFIAGSILFAVLGSNRQMSVGADSTIAPLFAIAVAHLATTVTTSYIDLIGILCVAVGVLVALVGLLHMGWVAEFLSAPIISGFMGGVAIIIVIHQLPDLFGLASVNGSNLHRVSEVISHLGSLKAWPLGIAVVVLALVVLTERFARRIPGALVGVVGSTVLVGVARLKGHGVAVLGNVAHGAPRLGIHEFSLVDLEHLLPIAGVVALVVISQSAATSRAFAESGHYSVDIGRDFIGVGAGSIAAGLVGSFPVNASPARTAAVAEAGGKTQLTGLVAAGAMIAIVPAAGLLRDLPLAALAAVLVYIASRIAHVKDFVAIARFDLFELGLSLITLLAVAFIGVQQGIAVAIGLAVLDRTRLSIQPRLHVLGRVPGMASWIPVDIRAGVEPLDGVLVALFSTPLWYANASKFQAEVLAALPPKDSIPPMLFVLDVIGMSDLDYTGAKTLREIMDELDGRHITFALARTSRRARVGLERSGLLARLGEDHLFNSVDDAIVALSDPVQKTDE